MNVSLNPHFNDFIDKLIHSGSYNSASEVIRDALRLLEQEDAAKQARIAYFRSEIQKGIESGSSTEWNLDETLAKAHKRLDNSEFEL